MPSLRETIRVLVVDADPFFRHLLRSQLEREGYQVIAVADTAAGLAAAEGAPPDLAILDVVMPGMEGLEVCRRLKSCAATRHVPVVILTASPHPRIGEEAHLAGAEVTIRKGAMADLLLGAVRLVLVRRGVLAHRDAGGAARPRGGPPSRGQERGVAPSSERRRNPRAHLFGALADAATAAIPLSLLNLSTSGALLQHEAPLSGEFTLVLRRGDAGPVASFRCRVVYSRRAGDGDEPWRYHTGVEFAGLSAEQVATLAEWVRDLALLEVDPAVTA